jgi:hypothetical protein
MKDGQIIREKFANPDAFRKVVLEDEYLRTQAELRSEDGLEPLRQADAKMVGALTTLFFAWRRIVGFFVYASKTLVQIEDRLRKHSRRLDALEKQAEECKCKK